MYLIIIRALKGALIIVTLAGEILRGLYSSLRELSHSGRTVTDDILPSSQDPSTSNGEGNEPAETQTVLFPFEGDPQGSLGEVGPVLRPEEYPTKPVD